MARTRPDAPIQIAGTTLGEERHICGFFRNSDEEYRLLLPFIKEGFDRGEKAVHVVDPTKRGNHVSRLEAFGIDVTRHERSGDFELYDWDQAYFADGRFDLERMLALWETSFDTARFSGYPRTRLIAHMEWALENRPGVNDMLECEARFNQLPRNDNVTICTYDLTKFRADVIVDVIRTHPMILIGGHVHENPFYVPPDEFVRELRKRERELGAASGCPV